jgi:hypothetical protein
MYKEESISHEREKLYSLDRGRCGGHHRVRFCGRLRECGAGERQSNRRGRRCEHRSYPGVALPAMERLGLSSPLVINLLRCGLPTAAFDFSKSIAEPGGLRVAPFHFGVHLSARIEGCPFSIANRGTKGKIARSATIKCLIRSEKGDQMLRLIFAAVALITVHVLTRHLAIAVADVGPLKVVLGGVVAGQDVR